MSIYPTNHPTPLANLEQFTSLLKSTFGLTPNDVDMDRIEAYLRGCEPPKDLIEWLGEKYDLTPIDDQTI